VPHLRRSILFEMRTQPFRDWANLCRAYGTAREHIAGIIFQKAGDQEGKCGQRWPLRNNALFLRQGKQG